MNSLYYGIHSGQTLDAETDLELRADGLVGSESLKGIQSRKVPLQEMFNTIIHLSACQKVREKFYLDPPAAALPDRMNIRLPKGIGFRSPNSNTAIRHEP